MENLFVPESMEIFKNDGNVSTGHRSHLIVAKGGIIGASE